MENKHHRPDKSSFNREREKRKLPERPWGGFSIFQLILWLVIVWFLSQAVFNGFLKPEVLSLSYSEFKEQVKKGNIAEVTVKGQELLGTFAEKYEMISDSKEDTSLITHFRVTMPSFQDPELIDILEANEVTIRAEEEDDSWLQTLLIIFLPWLLILGIFMYMRRRAQGQTRGMMGGGLFGFGKSRARRYTKESSKETFKDVAGAENAKRDLQEIIDYLREPQKFTTLGADIPKGILLVGPPGTGKTLLARATAGEAGVPFYSISGSEFIEMFVGVGASRVRDMFANAKSEAPSVIFIDEIDSIGRARGAGLGGGHDEREQTLNQILSAMDGFEAHESVIVLAATNRPDVLDPALTRPGRFDRHITMELPQKQARKEILRIHTRKVPLAEDVELDVLAARTVGFSGADLKNLVNEAALMAGRKSKQKVEREDFDEARDKIILGNERDEKIDDDEKQIVAYHEAGHALLAVMLPDADPLQKVTIIPRGRAMGVTEQIPEKDRYNPGRKYLLSRMIIMLGGRAAEKLIFDDITTGAANDLKQVTQLARRMVCQWGMSEKLGPVTFRQGEEHMFLGREMARAKDFSEHTAKLIDEEVRRIIQDMEDKALKVLQEQRDKLNVIAEALLDKETLDKKDVNDILESESEPAVFSEPLV